MNLEWALAADAGRYAAEFSSGRVIAGGRVMATKTTVLIAAILLLTCDSQQATGSTQSDWSVFSPEGGGFSVNLPGKPTERSLPQSTETERTPSPVYELTSGGLKYVILYKDGLVSAEVTQRDKFLEMAAEAGIISAGGKVVSNKPVSLGDYPGRELKGEVAGFLYQSRVYLVNQRLYVLIVWLPAGKAGSENAAKFFQSFKIVAR
jgi:hypothetical protein